MSADENGSGTGWPPAPRRRPSLVAGGGEHAAATGGRFAALLTLRGPGVGDGSGKLFNLVWAPAWELEPGKSELDIDLLVAYDSKGVRRLAVYVSSVRAYMFIEPVPMSDLVLKLL